MCQKMVREDKKDTGERTSAPPKAPSKSFEALRGAVEGRGCRLMVCEMPEDKKEKWAELMKKWKDSGMIVD